MVMTLQIAQMSRAEKLQVMEAIWADLSKAETEVESPAWHARVLRETEARVDAGAERITDWEIAKRELRKRFPYAIYYTVEGDTAVVWRVLDLRRHPDRTRRALKNRRTSP